MELRLLGDIFPCRRGILECFVSPSAKSLMWGFNIDFDVGQGRFSTISPQVNCDVLTITRRHQLRGGWQEVLPVCESWEAPYGVEGDPIATLYFAEHCPVEQGRVELGYARGGDLHLDFRGTVTLPVERERISSVPFQLSTEIEFAGIWCGKRNEDDAYALIEPYVDPAQFEFQTAEGDVSLMRPRACTDEWSPR